MRTSAFLAALLVAASTASAGVKVFDFADVSGTTYDEGLKFTSFSEINLGGTFTLHAPSYDYPSLDTAPAFTIGLGQFSISAEALGATSLAFSSEFLATGSVVSTDGAFVPALFKTSYTGPAFPLGTAYIGLRLTLGSDTHYGWFELQLTENANDSLERDVILTRFAFNDLAGASITTPTPVPEPSTYGLALGGLALAVAAIRRRRKA